LEEPQEFVSGLVDLYKGHCLDNRNTEVAFISGDQTWGAGASIVLTVEMCEETEFQKCADAQEIEDWRN